MLNEKRIKNFVELLDYLPKTLKTNLLRLPDNIKQNVTEIRLRAGRPLSINVGSETIFISIAGDICYLMQKSLYIVSTEEIDLTFNNMCNCSVYAFKEQIRQGYISLKNGCRAGIAATAVYENGIISGFNKVSSINIRLSSEFIGCADCLSDYFSGGLLIAGPPASGKTTLLRDSIRILSYGTIVTRKRVAVIDTRGEIASVTNGVPQNDIGPLTDVLTSCEKVEGIEIALRTLNPQVIAFDEISSEKEAKAVSVGFFSGVDIVTTVHAGSPQEILKRTAAVEIIKNGAIKNIAFINKIGAEPEFLNVSFSDGKITINCESRGVLIA